MSPSAPATWACAQCSSTFDKSKLLERHALQTSHKAYKCSKCPKTFGKRTALIRHNTTHSDVKSHACRVCGKPFYRKDHCAEHEEVCTHRLAVETRERLSASLAGSAPTSNDNVIATSEKTSPKVPRDQTVSHATGNRKRYREVDGGGDRSGSSSKTPADDLLYTARSELQEPRTSEPDQASRHNEAYIHENARQHVSNAEFQLPEALLRQYPALRDLKWGDTAFRDIDWGFTSIPVPPGNEYSPNVSIYTCTYHGCTQRLSSPASLETHKRECHRAPVANTRDSETDDDYSRSSQVSMESQTRRTSPLPLPDTANDTVDNLAANILSPSRTTNPHGPGIDSTPDFPVHLISMWPSSRESIPTNTSTPNNRLYMCTYPGCTRRFDSATDFQKHQRDFHRLDDAPNNGVYTCTYPGCTRRFDSPAIFQRHKRDFHRLGDDLALASSPPSAMTLPPGLYRMPLCPHHGCTQRFSSHEDYERHCQEHRNPRDNALPLSQTTNPQRAATDYAADFPAHLVSMERPLREQLSVKANLNSTDETMWIRQPRIFVVEERERVVSCTLGGFDCSVETGVVRSELVTKLGTGTIDPPDLIFIDADMGMGILRCVEAINVIRLIEQTKSIPIIIITFNIGSDDISTYFQHGVSDVLPTPFEIEDLFRMLEKHLAHLMKQD